MEFQAESRPLTVLLIEDDEDDYVLIRDLLSEISTARYDLTWVNSVDSALKELERSQRHVCLLDYQLGLITGLDLLKEIKARDFKTPIIFLTGRGEYRVYVEAMKGGAADYLVKDELTVPLLERSIRYAIERTQAGEALQKAYQDLEEKIRQRTEDLTTANAALKKSAEDIKFFAYSVSHDLKSPAISIYGLTKRLSDNYSPLLDEKGKRFCDQISKAAEQIASLVENINIYISEKENPLHIEELQLGDILQVVWDEFFARFGVRGIKWRQPDKLPAVRADRLSLIRALRNLVDNALKYGGDHLSEIRFSTRASTKFHVLSVSDDGVGIRQEAVKRIFRPFERNKSSRSIDGTGLGLAIVKEIAEQHRGKVWVEPGRERGMTVSLAISKNL
jgi:signal transduction histidine kinase